jgi:2,3-diaminopropionate biosynthesis protein SbnB
MLVVGAGQIQRLLAGREQEVLQLVANTYRRHDEGLSSLPPSSFLRLPDRARDRIIALPAYLGGPSPAAGIKWISSFPGNLERGLDRASAVIILNGTDTGRPEALLEASTISAWRTAASAALGAQLLTTDRRPTGVSLIGAGVINFAVLRFLRVAFPSLQDVTVHDSDPHRAEAFARRAGQFGLEPALAASAPAALSAHPLISLATTATVPHLDLSTCRPGSTVLHISLRDLYPEAILTAQNLVDDAEHVCREGTSLDLAQQISGDRRFIHATVGQLLRGRGEFVRDPERIAVFSPFGLGVLDLALADRLREQARHDGAGVAVDDFLPPPTPVPQEDR